MPQRWSTCYAAVLAFALTGCSTYRDVRDWWTEDQGAPTEEEWAAYRELYRNEGEAAVFRRDADPAAVADRDDVQRRAPRPGPIQQSRLAPPAANPQPRVSAPARRPPRVESAPAVKPPATDPPTPTASLAPPAETPAVSETVSVIEVPILPPSLGSVAGMSEARLREVLGMPTAATESGAQKVWRYAGNGCSVEVIFFRDVTRNTYAALEQRTLTRDRTISSSPCLRTAPVQGPSG